ncbi:MAG TPA: FAD synthase [Candidatus Methanoperedenaceae archaeon]|nr:FAD synthase [Candidatus Methanoperedenaceae archaeon]
MVRVLATGTFDILHPGHLLYLREAAALGDELYVIVARESMVKHKPMPVIPEEQRLAMVGALSMVTKAMLGDERDMFLPLHQIKPDIIALGHDQFFNENELERQLREHGIHAKVFRVKAQDTCGLCSSAAIIKRIKERR